MYTVMMGHECSCFKKSEYEREKSFESQQEAYQYANILSELMNEDFCSTHQFIPQITNENDFVITVTDNPNAGSCGTGSSSDSGCGTSCGCN